MAVTTNITPSAGLLPCMLLGNNVFEAPYCTNST